jgi:hypothetical protein
MRRSISRRMMVSGSVVAATMSCLPSAHAQTDASSLRTRLVMADEPVDPLTPTAAKETLLSKDAPKGPQQIVIAGRIGAKGMEPFLENKASFVLQEIPADDHAGKAGHDADNCPFCKKRSANAPMVAVQFVGEGAGCGRAWQRSVRPEARHSRHSADGRGDPCPQAGQKVIP